jgi:hypothetical protein
MTTSRGPTPQDEPAPPTPSLRASRRPAEGRDPIVTRREHYRDLYAGPVRDGRPLGLVLGNCQAEALRVLLSGSPTFSWQLARVPPVHELEPDDLPALDRLLGACTLLLTQPVAADYRGLPLGAEQVSSRLTPGATVVRWPVVRHVGTFPWQATVRLPDGAEPPLVPYHDLRTLTGRAPRDPDLAAAAERSLQELARREQRDTDVGVSDALAGLGADAMHTLNHPGNAVLVLLARRVQEALGSPADATDPGRTLLGGIRTPLEPGVLDALGLDRRGAREHWLVDGQPVAAGTVERAQRDWYAQRPDAVAEGLVRYADVLPELGLADR